MTRPYRPVPGKRTVDPQGRVVLVKGYGSDAGGEYVEVQLAGSYRARVRLPVSAIRPLTDEEREADVALLYPLDISSLRYVKPEPDPVLDSLRGVINTDCEDTLDVEVISREQAERELTDPFARLRRQRVEIKIVGAARRRPVR